MDKSVQNLTLKRVTTKDVHCVSILSGVCSGGMPYSRKEVNHYHAQLRHLY